jgi:hypothetical protein
MNYSKSSQQLKKKKTNRVSSTSLEGILCQAVGEGGKTLNKARTDGHSDGHFSLSNSIHRTR